MKRTNEIKMKKFICFALACNMCYGSLGICEQPPQETPGQAAIESASAYSTIAWTTISVALLLTTGIIIAVKIQQD